MLAKFHIANMIKDNLKFSLTIPLIKNKKQKNKKQNKNKNKKKTKKFSLTTLLLFNKICRVINCSPNPKEMGYKPNKPNTINL